MDLYQMHSNIHFDMIIEMIDRYDIKIIHSW